MYIVNNTNLLFYSQRDQKTEMGLTGLKSGCRQNCISSGGSRGEFVSLPFQFPMTACISWLMAPSSNTQRKKCDIFKTLTVTSFFVSLSHLHWTHLDSPRYSPNFKVSWLATIIPFATLIPPWYLMQHIHVLWGLGHGLLWEGHNSAYHY